MAVGGETGSESRDRANNWKELANHLQIKVHKRTSEVTILQTRAGFLIAATVVVLQMIANLGKFNEPWLLLGLIGQILAALCGFGALVLAIASMHVKKSNSPLNPDEMILALTERPQMSEEDFSNWLAKSYALANKEFNKVYNKKYTQQVAAAVTLLVAFSIAVIWKGIDTYV